MRKFFAQLALMISLLLTLTALAFGQDDAGSLKNNSVENKTVATPQTGASDSKNELSVQGGFAPFSRTFYGGTRPSSFGFAALRYSRHLIGSKNVALKYTVDVIPVAVVSYDRLPVVQTSPGVLTVQKNRETVYGFGLTPVGFQVNFLRQKKIQPFITTSAGLIGFSKRVPDDSSTVFPNRFGKKLNFTLAGGGGVEFLNDNGRSFTVGFKFHHISNASSGNINPGLDQNLFYVGYTFKKW